MYIFNAVASGCNMNLKKHGSLRMMGLLLLINGGNLDVMVGGVCSLLKCEYSCD